MVDLPSLLVTEPLSSSGTAERDPMSINRLSELAVKDRESILLLLDSGSLCHVGFVADDGLPVVIPTLYVRRGDELILHGSVASRLARHIRSGATVCATITLLDGLVLARSAFETSMNYRSVVVRGRGRELTDPDERLEALRDLSEAVLPGRWADVRHPDGAELRRTMLVAIAIEQCSAKVSDGHPEDPEPDLLLDVWAGRVPLRVAASPPVPSPDLRAGIEVPSYLEEWVDQHS